MAIQHSIYHYLGFVSVHEFSHHLVGSVRFIFWNHVSCSIHHIVCHTLIFCYPTHQTVLVVGYWSPLWELFPPYLPYVFLRLHIRNNCICIPWKQQNLYLILFQLLEERNRWWILHIVLSNKRWTGLPIYCFINVESLLHWWLVEVISYAIIICAGTTRMLLQILFSQNRIIYLVERCIPESPST